MSDQTSPSGRWRLGRLHHVYLCGWHCNKKWIFLSVRAQSLAVVHLSKHNERRQSNDSLWFSHMKEAIRCIHGKRRMALCIGWEHGCVGSHVRFWSRQWFFSNFSNHRQKRRMKNRKKRFSCESSQIRSRRLKTADARDECIPQS